VPGFTQLRNNPLVERIASVVCADSDAGSHILVISLGN
jgi:hypothetical protein